MKDGYCLLSGYIYFFKVSRIRT